jgi:glycosyltransferase involved in cell wall biosynthesis
MRNVILTREYPPDTAWGGCAIINHDLARMLAKKGHEVHVICQGVNKEYDSIEEGVNVHRVGTDACTHSILARIKYMFAAWKKLGELYKEKDIDIVQADYWGGEGIISILRRKSPLVIKAQAGTMSMINAKNYPNFKSHFGLLAMSWLANFVTNRADRVIFESRSNFLDVMDRLNIDKEKICIIYNGIDTNRYRYIPTDRNKFELPDGKIVLFVGRIEQIKGIETLIESIPAVLQKIPNTKFLLVGQDRDTAPGGGSFKSWMKSKASEIGVGDSIIFKDAMTPVELCSLYSVCDVLVLPSREESFGLVVVEAMSCGRPVVATSVGIIKEIAKDNIHGLEVVPIDDGRRLADGIIKMLSIDDKEKAKIAIENRSIIEQRYSIDRWSEQIITVYCDLIKG